MASKSRFVFPPGLCHLTSERLPEREYEARFLRGV